MKKLRLFLFPCAVVTAHLLLTTSSLAQTPADIEAAQRQSEQIMREQQLRQDEQIERSLERARPPASLDVEPPPTQKGTGAGCRDIADIEITGAASMPGKKQAEAVAPFEGRCLGVEDIQSLLGIITKYYIEAGFATTRAYLPAQDLSTGTLRVEVVEGRIGDIRLHEENEDPLYLGNIFPRMKGEVLNLRDIEQGLDQLNRLASNDARMDIVPGETVGESIIVVRNETTKPWHASITADNYGAKTTGRRQLAATASLDNLFGSNELISLTERRTIPFGDKDKRARSRSALVTAPFGYTTFTLGYTWSDYNSTVTTPSGNALALSGDNRSVFGAVDHVVYRSQDTKATLSATLTQKHARNYAAGQLLDVSSRILTIADLGAAVTKSLLGGTATLGATYSRGLDVFGAMDDEPGLPSDFPRAQFQKASMTASFFKPFTIADHNFSWSSALTAQKAFDTLYGSEQLSIGGLYTVRGFRDDTLANDTGYYIRNDLAMTETVGTLAGKSIVARPYVALDAGAVTGKVDDSPDGTLVGGAVGLSLSAGPATFEIFTGKPLLTPDGMDKEEASTFGRFSVSF